MIAMVNLVPPARRAAFDRSDRFARWAIILVAYALVLSIAWLVLAHLQGPQSSDLAARVRILRAECEESQSAAKTLRTQLAAAQIELNAARIIGEHPDWSILTGLLARIRTDDLVFESLTIQPSQGQADLKKPGVPPRSYDVRISGFGRSHRDVTQFTLRLEDTKLFSRVTLGDTRSARREDGSESISFVADCTLSDAPQRSLP